MCFLRHIHLFEKKKKKKNDVAALITNVSTELTVEWGVEPAPILLYRLQEELPDLWAGPCNVL